MKIKFIGEMPQTLYTSKTEKTVVLPGKVLDVSRILAERILKKFPQQFISLGRGSSAMKDKATFKHKKMALEDVEIT